MARREVLNDPVRLGERAPDILICAAARPPKLTRVAAPNGGYLRYVQAWTNDTASGEVRP